MRCFRIAIFLSFDADAFIRLTIFAIRVAAMPLIIFIFCLPPLISSIIFQSTPPLFTPFSSPPLRHAMPMLMPPAMSALMPPPPCSLFFAFSRFAHYFRADIARVDAMLRAVYDARARRARYAPARCAPFFAFDICRHAPPRAAAMLSRRFGLLLMPPLLPLIIFLSFSPPFTLPWRSRADISLPLMLPFFADAAFFFSALTLSPFSLMPPLFAVDTPLFRRFSLIFRCHFSPLFFDAAICFRADAMLSLIFSPAAFDYFPPLSFAFAMSRRGCHFG
jgi:hypothetical protein